jgi:RND family efflux transporter MFP subunit
MRPTLSALVFASLPAVGGAQPIDCLIEPRSMIELASSERGLIEEILVGRGDWVAEGDPLVRLEDEVQRLQVEMAATRMGSDLDIRAEETRLELRRSEFERATQLQERNVATATELENARIEVALTELAIEEAELARDLARIEHAQAVSLLDRRTIRSPADGVVIGVEAAEGEFASEQATMLTIAAMDPLHVEVFAPLEYFQRIAVGQDYEVVQASPLQGRFAARVKVVDQVFDAASGTFGVRLEIANPDGLIPAGTRCTIDLDAPRG